MRISDWSSDVCSSDLVRAVRRAVPPHPRLLNHARRLRGRRTPRPPGGRRQARTSRPPPPIHRGMTDTSTPRPAFETFDPAVAELMTTAAGEMGGIPDYIAIRTVEVGPGTMTAELDVRPALLNPFGSAHGGTLAALDDHVLRHVLRSEG